MADLGPRIQGMMSGEGSLDAHEHEMEQQAESHRREVEAHPTETSRRPWWRRLLRRTDEGGTR